MQKAASGATGTRLQKVSVSRIPYAGMIRIRFWGMALSLAAPPAGFDYQYTFAGHKNQSAHIRARHNMQKGTLILDMFLYLLLKASYARCLLWNNF
jgi:hypothetical protein